MKQSKQVTTVENPVAFIPIDITKKTMPGAYGTRYHNIWRVDDTIIVYLPRESKWRRYPLDSDEAREWALFMRCHDNYKTFTARLRQYIETYREVAETVDRAAVEAYLAQYIIGHDHIKSAYMSIAQISAMELINQRFKHQDHLPMEEVRSIIENQVNMCVDHYESTLRFMERER